MVCFGIYAASNAVAKAHRAVLEPWEFTYTQFITLREIEQSSAELSVKELGERLGLDSGTLSPLLRRLEQRELIHRQRSTADERQVLISATTHGSLITHEILDKLLCLRTAYGFESEEEVGIFLAQLHRITEGMQKVVNEAQSA